MKFKLILLFCLAFVGCNTQKVDEERLSPINNSNEVVELTLMSQNKNLKVSISMDTTILNSGDKILVNIDVENNDTNTVKFLFTNPSPSFGLWATTASLIDTKTNRSMLKYANKSVLQSQIYTEEDLAEHYHYLKPGESINGVFDLTDIVVLSNYKQMLEVGSYKFQLFYYSIASNTLEFTIK